MLNKDADEKRRRGYTDPKSFVRLDGSEVLHGKDWKARVEELRVRSGGRCEALLDGPDYIIGERCRREAADPHHCIPRSKRRDDRLNNLKALCRPCHDLLDKRKPRWSRAERYRKAGITWR